MFKLSSKKIPLWECKRSGLIRLVNKTKWRTMLRFGLLFFLIGISMVALTGCRSSAFFKQRQSKEDIYYVSPNGNDKASGKSEDLAWKSLKHALRIVRSSAQIRVLPGIYKEQIEVKQVSKLRNLKVIGFKGRPVFDGKRKINLGFWFTNFSNITVENLQIRNFTDVGIGAENSKNVTFRNLIVHDNGFNAQLTDWEIEGYGIHIDSLNGYLIENNRVYRNGPRPKKFPDKFMGTGIDTFGSKKGIIRNNKSYKNIGGGILVEDSTDITIEKNEVYGNDLDATKDSWWDGGIWLDGGGDITIRDNNFHDNIGPGILISDEEKQKPKGYVLKNNISSNNYFGIYIWNFGVNSWPKKSIVSQFNNDFSNNKKKNIVIHDFDYDPKTLKMKDKQNK